MAKRLAVSTLNASTIDILNVIRQNASTEYQSLVPEVDSMTDIPKVGEVIYGNPGIANQFLNALVNRIALVRVNSATFNNPYARLKKGYLEYGETVEEIFVNIATALTDSAEFAEARELRRSLPDVRSAFHVINWRVMYPVTIQDEDLRQAFLSIDGVQNLIARIVDSVYTAAEADEFLLFKYMLIKAITKNAVHFQYVDTTSGLSSAAIEFRSASNLLPFLSTNYNEAGVSNTTPKSRQIIFMDASFNARFDVDVLSAAFNMDKADFTGSLYLIDRWDEFDFNRFHKIMANSDGIEEITPEELAIMKTVRAAIVDEEWFQVYDNLSKFTEKYVASGLYWNYFYHVWKTVSHSPFANAVVFLEGAEPETPVASFTVKVASKDVSGEGAVAALVAPGYERAYFVQTPEMMNATIGITPYGEILSTGSNNATAFDLIMVLDGHTYKSSEKIDMSGLAFDQKITMNLQATNARAAVASETIAKTATAKTKSK